MTTIDSEECLVIIFITYFDQFIKNKIFAKILKGGLKNFPGIWLQKCQQLEALPNLGGVLDGKKTRPKKTGRPTQAEFCRVFFSMKNSPLIGSCQLMFTFLESNPVQNSTTRGLRFLKSILTISKLNGILLDTSVVRIFALRKTLFSGERILNFEVSDYIIRCSESEVAP